MKYLWIKQCCSLVVSIFVLACSNGNESFNQGAGDLASGARVSSARMAIVDDYLYAISGDTVQLFNLEESSAPSPWVLVEVGFNIETLFPHDNYLLVGAQSGVFILDNTDRASPMLVGQFAQATAQNPVVARANLAYVSLRSFETDEGEQLGENRLEVIDISDPSNPQLLNTISMTRPAGMTIDGDSLHVCDGDSGLKTFSLENPREPRLMFGLPNARCKDLLMADDVLVATGLEGIQQYDLTMGRPLLISELTREPTIVVINP